MNYALDDLYITNSKNRLFNKRNKKAHQFHYDESVFYLTEHAFTTFNNSNQIELPKPKDGYLKKRLFKDVVVNRESIRNYSTDPISLNELSTLLYYSAGTKSNKTPRKRNVPSGGNLNSTDIYFFSLNISGLDKGFYHYDFINHALNSIKIQDFDEMIEKEIIYQPELTSVPLLIILIGNLARVKKKYGMRAFRIVLIDCGALVQNIYLVSEAMGFGSCAIGGVVEYRIEEILDINGMDHVVMLAHSVGKKL